MAYDHVKEVDCLDVSKEGTESWDAACKRSVHPTALCVNVGMCVIFFLSFLFVFLLEFQSTKFN